MVSSPIGASSFTVALAGERATEALMLDIAALLEPGDVITLSGDLGAGKTTFARALIRHLAGDASIEVPSPTFTLMQTYELPRFPLVHVDLYRLAGAGELTELGVEDVAERGVVLIEWPDRAAGALPADRLDIELTLSPQHGETFRNARVTGYGAMAARAERIVAIRSFLNASGFAAAARERIQGDASTRSYERLTLDGKTYILMNSPRRPDGPPIRNGKPYSAIAHLAESVTPFLAMARGLRERGFSAPAIIAADREAGLIILEDLGREGVVTGDPPAPIEARYQVATDVLVALHGTRLPETLPVAPGVDYRLPRYDIDALLIEAELLLDWYVPRFARYISSAMRDTYLALWHDALKPVVEEPATWVLRDFHSPNLMWLGERSGIARIGLLDFQDAVIGSPAYDLASLLLDARVDVPEMMEIALLSHYTRARLAADPGFDAPRFAKAYATLAAQRCSKISRHFRAPRRPRRQATIFASYAAGMGLSEALAGTSGAVTAFRLVHHQRAAAESLKWMSDTAMQPPPRRAMVLAAGLGTRMRPLTNDRPKALVEVAGKALIDYVLDRLAAVGVELAIVNVHHFADLLQKHLAARKRPQIVISDERAMLLGTGGAVVKALPLLGNTPFFPSQRRHHLGRRRQAEPRAACRDLRSHRNGRALVAGADHRLHRLCRPRRFLSRGGRHLARPRRRRGCALCLCRCRDPQPDVVQGHAAGRIFAHRPVHARDASRPPLRPAARGPVDACRHARRDSQRRGGDAGERALSELHLDSPPA